MAGTTHDSPTHLAASFPFQSLSRLYFPANLASISLLLTSAASCWRTAANRALFYGTYAHTQARGPSCSECWPSTTEGRKHSGTGVPPSAQQISQSGSQHKELEGGQLTASLARASGPYPVTTAQSRQANCWVFRRNPLHCYQLAADVCANSPAISVVAAR